ncbi:MAG TPA: hypothetical protein VG267_07070 [Terracidiphilus sp.]|nr:hypothetical protein [Terracidiphilus sp.]
MFHKTLHAISIFALGVVAAAALHSQPQMVAHVLDIKGEWRLDGSSSPLKSGQGLTAGARIRSASGHAGDAITIVRDDDMSRLRVACDGSANDPCRNPIAIADSTSGQSSTFSQVKGMMQAALSVLLNKPPAISSHYAMTLSRGADSMRELEAVAALDPLQGVVPPPPPQDMPAGSYTFSIARAGESSSSSEKKVVLTSEGTWRPVSIDAPGLYEVTIRNGDEESVADLMLLVVSPAQYSAERDEFEALRNAADSWTGPNAKSDEHLLLRAFLVSESRP